MLSVVIRVLQRKEPTGESTSIIDFKELALMRVNVAALRKISLLQETSLFALKAFN